MAFSPVFLQRAYGGSTVNVIILNVEQKTNAHITKEWVKEKTRVWLTAEQVYAGYDIYPKLLRTLADKKGRVAKRTIKKPAGSVGLPTLTLYSSSDLDRECKNIFATAFEDVPLEQMQQVLMQFRNGEEMLPAAIMCAMRSTAAGAWLFAGSVLEELAEVLTRTFQADAPRALLALSRLKRPETAMMQPEESWIAILGHAQECCDLMASNYRIISSHGNEKYMRAYAPTVLAMEDSVDYRLHPESQSRKRADFDSVLQLDELMRRAGY